MISQDKIGAWLEELSQLYSSESPRGTLNYVFTKLQKGTIVPKAIGGISLAYEIDDTNAINNFGKFPQGAVPFKAIYHAFDNMPAGYEEYFDALNELASGGEQRKKQVVVPFSRVLDMGMGECLERAILTQLAAQAGRKSFMVNGLYKKEPADPIFCNHSFNVVFKDQKSYLVDIQNPVCVEKNGKVTPYIAPILGIDESKCGEFILPDEWKDGRTYVLW